MLRQVFSVIALVQGVALLRPNDPGAANGNTHQRKLMDNNGNPDFLRDQRCMADVAGISLGCTANDVQVTNVSVFGNPTCNAPGDSVTFTATYTIHANAIRYDVGVWFAQDGQDALRGTCTVSNLPTGGPGGYLQFDTAAIDTPDSCGDIDKTKDLVITIPSLSAKCNALVNCSNPSTNGFLSLPVCTSWRQPGNNQKCQSPLDCFPGAPSKCSCQQIPVPIAVVLCTPATCKTDNPCQEAICSNIPVPGLTGQCTQKCTIVNRTAGTPCGSPTVSACDNADTCNGAGVCQSNPKPPTTVCRPQSGACDVAEFCDGAGSCPAQGFAAAGLACGNQTSSVCDNPDTCNGSGVCLPNPKPATTVCRAANGACDPAEFCDGLGSCPAQVLSPAGTVCGSQSSSVCDDPDTCNGAGVCQPNPKPVTTVCRAKNGDCDPAEFCDGAGNCPAQLFSPSGTACGSSSSSVCDNPDTCNGSGTCLPNPKPASTVCRAANGDCDPAEFCDGAGSCPGQFFTPSGTPCGSPASSVCNNPDTCNGSGSCLPNFEPASTVCRPQQGDCDVAEFCDGAGNCPAQSFKTSGAACGSPGSSVCDSPDTCDGAGVCLQNPKPETTVCRPQNGDCDPAEFCDGVGGCPTQSFSPPGAPCGAPSQSDCDNPDTCDGFGACLVNHKFDSTPCTTDSNFCTTDVCQNGVCVHNSLDCVPCPDDGRECTRDVCVTGTCQHIPRTGEFCTSDANECTCDKCSDAGECVHTPTPGLPCGSQFVGDCDKANTCDSNGACLENKRADGEACTPDFNACTSDQCFNGLCTHPPSC